MSVTAAVAGTSGFGDPSSATLSSALAAGETLIFAFIPNGGQTITSVTVGGNAATQDISNSDYYVYRYYSASGGETSVSIDLSASGLCFYWYIVDNEIDNSDAVDTTVAYAASGEGFATAHQYDVTAGVPGAGGLAVCAARSSGRTWSAASGTNVISDTGDQDLAGLYKEVSAGAVALNHTYSAAGNSDGMIVVYNYAGGGGAQNVLAWIRA
jgi:hypothetical protein